MKRKPILSELVSLDDLGDVLVCQLVLALAFGEVLSRSALLAHVFDTGLPKDGRHQPAAQYPFHTLATTTGTTTE